MRPEGVTNPLQDRTQRKTAIEDANRQAIGGLRSSRLAIKKLPGWSAVGTRIRHCVQNLITDHEATLLNVVDSLGQDDCEDVPQSCVGPRQTCTGSGVWHYRLDTQRGRFVW